MVRLRPLFHSLCAGGWLLTSLSPTVASAAHGSDTLTLSRGWTFAETGSEDYLPATVPGVVQQDLLRLGRLPDPAYRLAETAVQWVGERDWTYRCSFALTEAQLRKPSAHLLFEGLDTYATVFLNGVEVLQSQNMFVGHEIDVRSLLRAENTLEIRFRSPLSAALPRYEAAGVNYPADNDHAPIHLSVFTRKAPYHYGWDWGERLLSIGPWRPVRLLLRGTDYLAMRPVFTYHPQRQLPIEVRLPQGAVAGKQASHLSYRLCDATGREVFARTATLQDFYSPSARGGLHAVPRLRLWYPRGYGEAYRYTAHFTLRDRAGRALDSLSMPVGFRTAELVREQDKGGRSFFFRINGQPVFAKGANYIPGAMMLPTRTSAQRKRLFDDVEGANFNMLRVWGGGIYESDAFYDEADARGILLWQDFMFACTPYPADSAFLGEVASELRYNIRRLRHHPSLVTWCGNNEIREGLKYWGWAKKYPQAVYEGFWRDYHTLFAKLIPETLQREDPTRPYIESSPDTVNWGRPGELGLGESHYWGVWYGREPFAILRERMPRFMSEFGVQSFPLLSSLHRFARPEDFALDSPVMRARQKSSTGNEVILHYIRMDYDEPRDFGEFCYLSQVMQGQGIGFGMRVQRAAAPYCMGSLYWQLNDAWPAISWSSIDYYGRWKALHYQARRAFAPLIIVPDSTRGEVLLAHDPQEQERRAVLETGVRDMAGRLQGELLRQRVTLSRGLGVEAVPLAPSVQALQGEQARQVYIHYRLLDAETGQELASYIDYAVRPKELRLEAPRELLQQCTREGEDYVLTFRSDRLLRDVCFETEEGDWHFSDNFFDALPGVTYRLGLSYRGEGDTARAPRPSIRLRYLGAPLQTSAVEASGEGSGAW